MHTSTLLIAFTAITASWAIPSGSDAQGSIAALEERKCYSGGDEWGGGKTQAYDNVIAACGDGRLALRGQDTHYDYNEEKSFCFDLPGDHKMILAVKKISDIDVDLTEEACRDGLNKEIHGCTKGGQSGYANWQYK